MVPGAPDLNRSGPGNRHPFSFAGGGAGARLPQNRRNRIETLSAAPENRTEPPGAVARRVIRGRDRAVLATRQRDADGWPYGSLVLAACDHGATPILLMSDLAEHTRNIAEDARVSLLYDGTAALADPLTGARVTVMGEAAITQEAGDRARYLARHATARGYADFGDFRFYRVRVTRAHLVAGFGRIDWIDAADLLCDVAGAADLVAAEHDIVAHMNDDHAGAIGLCANTLLGLDGTGWQMCGVDPEGLDLCRDGLLARLAFDRPVTSPEEARAALVALVARARSAT